MILLDTNAVIAILNGRPPRVRDRLADAIGAKQTIGVSTIVLFELAYGAAKSARPRDNADRITTFLAGPLQVLAFESPDAEAAGVLRTRLEKAGTPIGPFDCLIAGQALRNGATLITANRREFARIPGLVCDDWSG